MNIILLIALLAIGGIRAFHLSHLVDEESSSIKGAEFFVSIRLEGKHKCGGALITSKIVITMAECVVYSNYKRYDELSIMVGASLQNGDNREIPIKRMLFPAGSKTRSGRRPRTIAALIPSNKMKLSKDYPVILMPRRSIKDVQRSTLANQIVATLITLRGEKIEGYNPIKQLQVQVNSSASCTSFIAHYGGKVSNFFCGTTSDGELSGTDGGSPLVYDDQLIGIARGPKPPSNVYLDVYEHLEFIYTAIFTPEKLYIVS